MTDPRHRLQAYDGVVSLTKAARTLYLFVYKTLAVLHPLLPWTNPPLSATTGQHYKCTSWSQNLTIGYTCNGNSTCVHHLRQNPAAIYMIDVIASSVQWQECIITSRTLQVYKGLFFSSIYMYDHHHSRVRLSITIKTVSVLSLCPLPRQNTIYNLQDNPSIASITMLEQYTTVYKIMVLAVSLCPLPKTEPLPNLHMEGSHPSPQQNLTTGYMVYRGINVLLCPCITDRQNPTAMYNIKSKWAFLVFIVTPYRWIKSKASKLSCVFLYVEIPSF